MNRLEKLMWNNRLLMTLILILVATVLSTLKLCVLSKGGCLTLMSLGIVWLITYFYGTKWGAFWSTVVFSIIKFLITYYTGETINYQIGALLLEYPIAFFCLSLGGFLPVNSQAQHVIELVKKREKEFAPADKTICAPEPINIEYYENSLYGLIGGYLLGIAGLFLCYVVSAVLFYAPDRPTFFANLLYAIKYDVSYLLIEAVITVIFFLIPGVHKALFELKHITNNKKEDPSGSSF